MIGDGLDFVFLNPDETRAARAAVSALSAFEVEPVPVPGAARFGAVSEQAKKALRAEKFGIVAEDLKKQKRSERFGLSSSSSSDGAAAEAGAAAGSYMPQTPMRPETPMNPGTPGHEWQQPSTPTLLVTGMRVGACLANTRLTIIVALTSTLKRMSRRWFC